MLGWRDEATLAASSSSTVPAKKKGPKPAREAKPAKKASKAEEPAVGWQLPRGWKITRTKRPSDESKSDRYFESPRGTKKRSQREVDEYLAGKK